MTPAKTILVLWSGGLDSTGLIEHCLADPQYDTVLAGYVLIGNNEAKTAAELAAIARMWPLLAARNSKFAWLGTLMQVHFTRTNPNLAFKQIPVWLITLVEAIHTPVDEVAIGYIRNSRPAEEDASSHLDDLRHLYNAYQPFMHKPLPRLVFPVAHLGKKELFARLSPDLAEHCVTCAQPVATDHGYQPCGHCPLCLRRAEELQDLCQGL